VKTLAKVLNLEEVPFDLIYTNRTYGKMNFTDMVGPTVDAASFLISVSENEPLRISGKISEKIKYCIDNNMNFTNMEWNLPTIWKWRKLVKYMGNNPAAAKGQVLFNYAGQVEKEYDKIFERSIDMFDEEHQDTFDFGNFYVVAKSSEEELQFIFFTKVVKDAGAIEEAFEKAAADLKEYYKKYHKELIMEEEK